VLAAVIAGALSGRLQGSSGDDFEAPPDRPLILSLVSISVGLLALWQGRAELSAQWLMTRADILSRSGQIIAAVETLEQAIAVSDISPRLRTRLYPEVMAAGPRFWAKKYSSAQIESAYALAVSASPSNPVLLDMRLKYLTHLPDLPMPCSEVERMIKLFKRTTDAVAPNTHIMEAAFALRLNDLERTAAALARARAFTDPPMRPKRITKNYENNLRNIGYLEAAMEKRRQRRSEAGDRGTQADPEERSPPAGC
jgi:hypothetical protein